MKFYDCRTAPSPRGVRIFLAEKGIGVPTVQVDLRNGEHFGAAFRAINPDCAVPVLTLDSGTAITDIVGICRYFEEIHPDPRLMGGAPEDKAPAERGRAKLTHFLRVWTNGSPPASSSPDRATASPTSRRRPRLISPPGPRSGREPGLPTWRAGMPR